MSVTMYHCKDALITSKPKLEPCSYLDAKRILPLVRPVSKSLYYVGLPSSTSLPLTGVGKTRLQTYTILHCTFGRVSRYPYCTAHYRVCFQSP
jgi:hypothetical protein